MLAASISNAWNLYFLSRWWAPGPRRHAKLEQELSAKKFGEEYDATHSDRDRGRTGCIHNSDPGCGGRLRGAAGPRAKGVGRVGTDEQRACCGPAAGEPFEKRAAGSRTGHFKLCRVGQPGGGYSAEQRTEHLACAGAQAGELPGHARIRGTTR